MAECDALRNYTSRYNTPEGLLYVKPSPIRPNPDIAGIGVSFRISVDDMIFSAETLSKVTVAFAASAWTTLALVLLFYGAGYIEETQYNHVDSGVLYLIRKVFRLDQKPGSEAWKLSLRRAVIMFGD